ncbi:FecR family protein [Pedobacter rhizosphaerae]|uniref:FecR family protein n=1 Tax=Pedobacter rhizosphaerae TaxID=390241 RepID=A0A1H9QP01_9SPHI|nr:FecR domain-containing protein [Pedobacter rhizosphaerae]SER62140.1 FecR family protein [Pedobacter rhizosphaerae]
MQKEEFFQLTDKINDGSANEAELELYIKYFNSFQTSSVWDEKEMGDEQTRGQMLLAAIDRSIAAPLPVKRLKLNLKWVASIAAILVVAVAAFWFINVNHPVVDNVANYANQTSTNTNELIQLPDGSTVILSAGSTMSYSSIPGKIPVREVKLKGQAFFDVKHIDQQPFIVRTESVTTHVLGTAFEVNANGGKIIVTVARGKVGVTKDGKQLGMLTPNKQVIYDKARDKSTIHDINAKKTSSWSNGDLVFTNITVGHAANFLQQRFNVNIIVKDEALAKQQFTTKLFENQSLTEILTLICDFNNAEYTFNESTKLVTIKPKN